MAKKNGSIVHDLAATPAIVLGGTTPSTSTHLLPGPGGFDVRVIVLAGDLIGPKISMHEDSDCAKAAMSSAPLAACLAHTPNDIYPRWLFSILHIDDVIARGNLVSKAIRQSCEDNQ